MGILILGNFLSGLIGGLIPGGAGFYIFRRHHDHNDRDTWRRYTLFACVGGLMLAGMGILQLPSESSGAPSGSDYFGAMTAAFLVGLAPGGGLLAGCLAALTKGEE